MQEFKLDRKFITLMKGGLVVFVVFLALGLALPFLPDEENGNPNGTIVTTIMCTVVFGFFTIFTWLTLRKLPYADVVIDDDGIWYKHLGKDQGLVAWENIYKVKERAYLQCLDILGVNGDKLLRVEYQLNGFETLRNTLNEKISKEGSEFKRSSFSKGPLYHIFYLVSVVGFSALGLYVGTNDNPLLGYGAMSVLVIFIIYEYFVTATGIRLANNSFEITYPVAKRNIPLSGIEDIQITDEFHKGNRIPEVWVISKMAKKPFKLKQLGVDSNILYNVLRKATRK